MNKKQKETAAWLLQQMTKDSGYDYSYVRGEIFYRGERPALTDQKILSIISTKLNKKSDWRKIAQDFINSQSDEDSPKQFILVQDDSCHWYIIPSDKREDWLDWLNSDEIEQGCIPSYADRVGGHPCKVTFQNYRIDHICCGIPGGF